MIPDEVRALLEGTNIAHIATLGPDGEPHSVAVWIGTEGDQAYFFTQETSRKARNLAADPRVAISIVDRSNPYRTGWLRGRVTETVTGDEALQLIDRLSERYTGKPFPMRSGTVYLIECANAGSMSLPFEPPA
jgi:PPOX class probable F420-dependent enzyme